MPRLIKKDTIRLLEASIEALNLACIGLAIPKKKHPKSFVTLYSPEIGLIGVAAELAMSSLLVQSYGMQILKADENRFKTGAQILDDFKKLINEAPPVLSFLTNGITEITEHRQKIIDKTIKFKILITARANALHNGYGLNYETTSSVANDVSEFLEIISKSTNLKPYLLEIPKIKGISNQRTLIVEDLVRLLNSNQNIAIQQMSLTSLFLILPELPTNLPEWLSAFERFTISPKETDLVYLVNVLENALPANLHRTSLSGETIPVKVEPDNPLSIPIAPQYLRGEFTKITDQWYSNAGNANGRLNKKSLDLPQIDFINEVFAIGLYNSGILKPEQLFTAQQSWPFIVSSLNVNTGNTHGPFWFIVKATNDLGQLKAQMKKAAKFGGKALKENVLNAIQGIEAIENDTHIDCENPFFKNILKQRTINEQNLIKLKKLTSPESKYYLGEEYNELIISISEGNENIGQMIDLILNGNFTIEHKKYWTRVLAEAALEAEDLDSLVKILMTQDFGSSHTQARKSIRLIDFLIFGPKIN